MFDHTILIHSEVTDVSHIVRLWRLRLLYGMVWYAIRYATPSEFDARIRQNKDELFDYFTFDVKAFTFYRGQHH